MPIGDLLDQISGTAGRSSSTTTTTTTSTLSRSNTLPKRKADEDLRNNVSKTPRTTLSSTIAPRSAEPFPRPRPNDTPSSKSTLPSRPLDRPIASQRPTNGLAPKPSVLSARPMNGSNRVTKPTAPSRPSPGPPAAPKAAPKKGSFAEILARGQRAQQVMGQVGKIQHKKVEKTAVKAKEDISRSDPRDSRDARTPAKKPIPGYSGTSKVGHRNGTSSAGPKNGASASIINGRDGRNGKAAPLTKAEKAKLAAQEEREKKIKRAAAATTGYTGTARPKPGNPVKKRDNSRGGALLNVRPARPANSRSRYEDDYDEELDDFIEYDDEDEGGGGPRYDYASDGSSDMEAGMDDIDDEERRAEKIARREDIEEERLERNLKMAKEERKRQALEALRAGRRR